MNNLVVKINRTEILNDIEKPLKKEGLERIDVGDTVKLGILIKEGEKERTQFYEGVVIAEKNSGINKTITVRKVLQGIGVERIFPIHSPKLTSIKIIRRSKVRRSKLYFLRYLSGKATRLKQRFD
jgi:large subunit ribosomal protein L19